ncbi:MAG: hypothetical protein IJ555_08845 [Ruminococcus sp.]|nr:hypothetical protein [Ruminococcus sp.]MBR1752995.1 hypothetical protein [Ruminococcus sp.]
MKELNENIMDTELELDDLSEVNGGLANNIPARASSGSVVAYCKSCNTRLQDLGSTRRNGGVTNIFKCMNPNCSQFGKEKTNLEVRFP